jgi:hypothetical protein
MAARGHPRAEHQTAREFARAVRPYLPAEERTDAELIVRLFERDRFSGEPIAEHEVQAALAAAERIGTPARG